MMNLAEYRNRNARLSDFLPWAALVREGVVLNKDGSLQRSARFRGPDLDSSVAAELVAISSRLNNAFRRLGSGWAIFVEAQRHAAGAYPESTELAIDDENRLLRAIRDGAQDTINDAGQQIIRRQLNVAPTLTIRPGFPVRVIVTRDLVLEPYGATQ
ncbi:TrbI/VirB10 family protein [Aminobacter sp. LjRoot7]|uniref:TrbI/VirB10 family protein n=1 Tax=Aminobacter sp. LjRoot7 TaxID=3342335 RepID=UPI003ED0C3FD